MNINWTDVIIVVATLLFIRAGWKFGLISNIFTGIGLIGGLLLGAYLISILYTPGNKDPIVVFSAFGLMIGCGMVGNMLFSFLGRLIKIPEGIFHRINSVLGALFGGAIAVSAAWVIGFAVATAPPMSISQSVKDSRALKTINTFMPTVVADQLSSATSTLTSDIFPKYLGPFEREVVVQVSAPDPQIIEDRRVRNAALSVVNISGINSCRKIVQGSGFVYNKDLVMTNAHVVAGVTEPTVSIHNKKVKGKIVVFNPRLDLAVIRVKKLPTPPLAFAAEPGREDRAAIVGYPESGPLTAVAARVRGVSAIKSPDIYGSGEYKREVISIRGQVVQGNSGGALISPSGSVYGVIFAASPDDQSTGYAISAKQAQFTAAQGSASTKAVSTGKCIQ